MKKILFVNASLSSGGSERVMALIASEIAKDEQFEVNMILLRKKDRTYEIDKRVEVIQFDNSGFKPIMFLLRIFNLHKMIAIKKPDYVVSFMDDIALFTSISCLGLKTKLIISIRNNPLRKQKYINKWLANNFSNPRAYKMVFQTKQARDCYPESIRNKSIIIANPINDSIPDIYIKQRKKNVVAVGRFTEQKNFTMLIRAFATFHRKHIDYKLIIYGQGHLLQQYIEEAERLKISEFVSFPGYVSDVDNQIVDAGIYVSSSNYEGISNAMLEAMAMGIPCICTDCPIGGARLVISHAENGILIPVGDEKMLYEQLCYMVEHPSFTAHISEEACKVRERFSIRRIVDQWKEVFI
ncbi:MAG: glycosyltransferase family 4 protein [Paenibacillaceae bacterium]|nr:glycosyltransferase family 4 protein [Paenibacillaceae bacterium]